MEAIEYRKMAAVEDAMWWYRALRSNLLALLGSAGRPPRSLVLDAGCGTGGMLGRAWHAPASARSGLRRNSTSEAARLARDKSGCPVVVGSIAALPFAEASFDAVLSADVLCHGGVDEASALAEMRRCLRPGGALLLNLPAYGWMLSEHDRRVDNVRRYTRHALRPVLAAASRRYSRDLLEHAVVAADGGAPQAAAERWRQRRAALSGAARGAVRHADRARDGVAAPRLDAALRGLGLDQGGEAWIRKWR